MSKTKIIFILVSVLVISFNSLPIVVGYATQKDGLKYLGRRSVNSQDVYTYVAFIEQARQGRILFENLYMPEKQSPSLIRPSYLFIGTIARLTGISSIFAYHLFRVLFSFLFCGVLYFFLKRFFEKDRDRLVAFTVILTSAGIGGLIVGMAPNSSDLWIPESITFLSMAEAPHFILSQMLMLLGFMAYLLGTEKKRFRFYILSAGCFLLLALEHPFNLFVTGVVVGILVIYQFLYSKAEKAEVFLGSGLILLVTALGIFYQWLGTVSDPILKSWMAGSSLPSPQGHNYLYGYGLLIIFALFGVEKALRERKFQYVLLLVWLAAGAVLLYSPFPFQRRFSEGLHIPLAIFAATGILMASTLAARFSIKVAQRYVFYIALGLVLLVLAITPVLQVANDISIISSDSPQGYYYHLLSAEVEAINYLGQVTTPKDIILSNWFYGNVIPGMIGRKVYLGHKVQTPFFDKKVEAMNKFLLEADPKKAEMFIRQAGFTYIFLGKNDTMLQYGFKPETKPYLKKIYGKDGVSIYKVVKY
ncbi:MAG: hypothetical protein ACM3IJ_00375 [Candidatus Levyibacteriota bacterium]